MLQEELLRNMTTINGEKTLAKSEKAVYQLHELKKTVEEIALNTGLSIKRVCVLLEVEGLDYVEPNPERKITSTQRMEIKKKHNDGVRVEVIANEYGISKRRVSGLVFSTCD